MKQLKVALPDDLRESLDAAVELTGRSLADEVRKRLERTFEEDGFSGPFRDLLYTFDALALMVRAQTGYEWNKHPEAFRALQVAIAARLNRFRPAEPVTEEPPFRQNPWVQSDDPEAIGAAIEAIDFAQGLQHNFQSDARFREIVKEKQRLKVKAADEQIRREGAVSKSGRSKKD